MKKVFKVGDTVYYTDKFNDEFKGKVIIDTPLLLVEFENSEKIHFLPSGHSTEGSLWGRLSFCPYNYILDGYSNERPIQTFKKGEVVFANPRQDCSGEWKVRYYSHYFAARKIHYCFSGQEKNGRRSKYYHVQKENPLI